MHHYPALIGNAEALASSVIVHCVSQCSSLCIDSTVSRGGARSGCQSLPTHAPLTLHNKGQSIPRSESHSLIQCTNILKKLRIILLSRQLNQLWLWQRSSRHLCGLKPYHVIVLLGTMPVVCGCQVGWGGVEPQLGL